jgi:hypothetical protein
LRYFDLIHSYTIHNKATAYEILLTELGKSDESRDEKILKVFEIFDQIVPNLGVYSPLMKLVRQQMFGKKFFEKKI